MFWNRRPEIETPDGPAGPGFSENLRALLASASSYLRARLELAGMEGKEAAATYGRAIAFVLGAAVLLGFGYIFLWIALIALGTYFTGWHWGWITLIAAVLHFIGVAVCLGLAYRNWGAPVFSATLEEFRKDQQWLSRTTTSHAANGKPL